MTHSLFHSRLKTFLFCKSFPPQPFLFFFRTGLTTWFHRLLPLLLSISVFTARRYASAVYAMALRTVCPSVRPSFTSRCSTKTAKHRITKTTPHDSPGTLVFWRQRSPRNSTGVTPTRPPYAGGVGQNRRLLTSNRLYLENSTRWTHSFY